MAFEEFNPSYVEKHFKSYKYEELTKQMFDNAKYIIIHMWDVIDGAELCESEIFVPHKKSCWNMWRQYNGKWHIVDEGDLWFEKGGDYKEIKDRIKMFADEFYYVPKNNTMKGFKTATYGKNKPQDVLTKLERAYKRMI